MKFIKKTLYVWDIDHTLFDTSATNVFVRKNGAVVKTLNPVTVNGYRKAPDETWDHSEFRSAAIFKKVAKPIDSVLNRAKQIVLNGDQDIETILLTARGDLDDKRMFLQKFRDHGFPIDRVYVERAGNYFDKYNQNTTAAATKGAILRKYIKTGNYSTIVMYDDDARNLDMLIKLAALHPEMTIWCFLVREGSIEPYFHKVATHKQIRAIKEALESQY